MVLKNIGEGHALKIVAGIMMLALLLAGVAEAEAVEQWNKTFGGTNYDMVYSVQQTSDGSYILAGHTASYGSTHTWLIKADTNGSQQWSKTFGGTNPEVARSVQQTLDGGYILAGHTFQYGNTYEDARLIKTDTNGSQQWDKTFGGTSCDYVHSVQQTSDGSYILAGTTYSYSAGWGDVWLIKADTNGSQQWNKTFGGTNDDYAYSVQQTSDDGYILAGSTMSYGAGYVDAWLIKTDMNGNQQWDKTFGGTNDDYAYSVQQTTDGGYILAGSTGSYCDGYTDAWLIKTDTDGNLQWNKTFGGTNYEWAYSVQQTSDGGYILAGSTMSYGAGYDAWLIKTDMNGNQQWNKTFGGTNDDLVYSVQQTSDGSYVLAGETRSYGAGNGDAWLIKVSGEANNTGTVHNINKSTNYYTIQAAIDDASPGNEIHVDSGTYYENVVVNKQLILLGESNFTTTIDGNGGEKVIEVIANEVVIEGFRIQNGSIGLYVTSIYNTLSGNTASNNSQYGILLYSSSNNNTLNGNTASNNDYGIYLDFSSNNTLYHNNLVDNTFDNAYDTSGNNQWDNAYPSGGNYWSDYSGEDQYSGPNQTLLGSDGIGDVPYEISGGGAQDEYPLIEPWNEQKIIPIGVLVDLSSWLSDFGIDAKNAIEIARDDVNDYLIATNEPYRVELFIEDTQASPSEALNKTQFLYNNGVRQIIGPLSTQEFIEILDFTNSSKIILASPSSTGMPQWLGITDPEERRYSFRFTPNDSFEAKAIAKVAESIGIKAVVILYIDNPWGSGLNESVVSELERYNIEVNEIVKYPDPVPTDYTPYITSLENAVQGLGNQYNDSEIAVITINYGELSNILEQVSYGSVLLDTTWIGGEVVVGQSMPCDKANRVKLYSPIFESKGEGYEELNETFYNSYGTTPIGYSLNAYDALWVLALANVESHGFDPDKIAQNISLVAENYSTGLDARSVSGNITFDEFNDRISGNFSIYSIKDCNWVNIGSWNIDTDSIDIDVDNTPPNVILTYPENNSAFNSPIITIQGNATDNVGIICSLFTHECELGGGGGGGCGGGDTIPQNISINRSVTLCEGWNRLTFGYTDVAGNTGYASITVTLSPPYVNTSVNTTENNITIIDDALEIVDTILEIATSNDTTDGSVSMLISSEIPLPLNQSFGIDTLGKYVSINLSDNLIDNLSWVIIKIYYKQAELEESGLDENSLVIRHYNETSEAWEPVTSSGVNTTNIGNYSGYVWANVSDFSYFGVGEELEEEEEEKPSNGGGGGGGGGGTSGEAFENILIQENDRQSVFMDDNVAFSFEMDGNIVRYVNFTSLTNSGTIVSKVEILNHTSTMVDVIAPDSVFKNLNIWLGNLGWASDKNIKDVTITFEVNRSWIQVNNIDPDTVTLSRYTNDTGTPTWHPLQTTLVAEEDEFLVYMSITTPDGFANFAVVGVEIGSQPQVTSTPVVTSTGTSSGTPVTEPTPASTGGSNFTWLLIGLVILLLVVGVGYMRRDLITKWLNERRP